ncbi:ferric reduction oxidase 7, chloroplastic-like [Cynara cardunculus var. scolymus]|uniref:ferric reduction oxidase 7, chloroplastic-like n=1 Tax=Cynara cardunculus var. scolymus TaxID=59895 RepID=UPI000D62FFDA|nr:ferric reduction oxidase 7, chloroplastic-like [Cynara cardunculus var. scolymus]
MGTEGSPHEPLLLPNKQDHTPFSYICGTSFLLKSTKWVLKFAMWFIFISWATFLFLVPSDSVNQLSSKLVHATSGTLFAVTGSIFLIYSGPVLMIAFLAIIYLRISGEEEIQEKKKKSASFRLWTFPILIDGPFGVVTAAELIGILLFSVYIIWAVTVYTIKNISLLSLFEITDAGKRNLLLLELTGLRFGYIGLICMAFLFLPVARGSVLLRLIDIPFEHATRYHVWLGHLTMMLFTLHGLFYVIAWAIEGRLIQELTAWKKVGIANLPGVISLVAGLLMWVTSLPPVRRINFELFFYTHQLYVVFVVFLAMHVGDFVFSIAAAGIFLFMLDRFLRFFQSRKTVDILSAKCLPSGTVELVISKPQGLQYNALGWVFVQIRELSWLQWHPFSVSSSPLDGSNHLAILIKVLGDWTEKLRGHISSVPEGETDRLLQSNFTLKASVEGPYGHESPYHLTYENLILVAGGIGISPFLAILSDILHRIQESKPCLPRNVLIVWAVKKSDELPLLQSLDLNSLCPYFYNTLNLEIQTYVTRESDPPLEEGKIPKYESTSVFPAPSHGGMSSLVGTGNIIWSGAYVVLSTIGLVVSVALLDIFYINPYNIMDWWYKGLLFIICMAASVVLFGGFVIGLWHLWDTKASVHKNSEGQKYLGGLQNDEANVYKNASREDFVNIIKYGQRPDFKEIFGSMAERWGNVDIGVMVCGPTALQTSIAKECRSKSFGRMSNEPIFHFNSHTFDL